MTTTTAPLDRATLADRLLRLVAARAEAVAALESTTEAVIDARTTHDNAAADYRLRGLDGRNEAERDATLRLVLMEWRIGVTIAESEQRHARAQVEQIDAELSVLKAVARLLAGGDA